jgi:hypothetical protein
MNFESMPKQETVKSIVLQYNDRKLFEKKLQDYEIRMNRHKSDNVPVDLQMDTICKKKLVEFLLDKGEISANDRIFIRQQLAEVYGADFDRDAYEKALKIIEDYAKTGGENTKGGDGFGEKAA